MAAPWHARMAWQRVATFEAPAAWWELAGMAAGLVCGAVAVVVPLRIGARALRRMEF